MDAIRIQGLQVHAAGRCLLSVPALTVRTGERVALVGPNGAGKSTLLKVLGGFAPVSAGTVSVLGRSFGAGAPLTAAQWQRLRAETGQVMQGLHLVPRLSALDNAVLGALARPGAIAGWRGWLRLYPADIRREAASALAALGLAQRLQTRADRLSGGERQKVGIARLRLQRPRLILADEPTSALDPNATLQACAALREVAEDATLLTVVHDPVLLPHLAERVIGLAGGRIVVDLPVHEVTAEVLDRLYVSEGEGEGGPGPVPSAGVPPPGDRPAAWAAPQPS